MPSEKNRVQTAGNSGVISASGCPVLPGDRHVARI